MLNLPRHVKVYLKNYIYSVEDGPKETKDLVYEFDCQNETEQQSIIYNDVYKKNSKIPHNNFTIETEALPVPEQDDSDIYEALEHCIDVTMGEGLIENYEYQFLSKWLDKHFNIAD